MAGLIPLMLGSSSRMSLMGPSQPTSRRRQSTTGFPGSPTHTHAPRPRLPKRLSLPIPVATPELPYTQADWKRTISQVKRQYFTKRYRACSARCLEVLDGVKDVSQVDPVYLIYLHFYAATSQEMCGRSLPSNSPLRTSLLQQARTHFDKAASLISAAEESVVKRVRSGSAISPASSCHSPSGSVSSRAWTPDTLVSSPTNSVLSFDDPPTPKSPQSPQPPRKRVKKVSFSLTPQQAPFHFQIPEPLVRPDSPTLGFDDSYFQAGAARQELPELPTLQPPLKFQEIELPLQLQPIPECDSECDASEQEGREAEQQQQQQQQQQQKDEYLLSRSVDRACEHLSALRAQLARHSTSLDQLLLSNSLSNLTLSSSSPLPSPTSPTSPNTTASTTPTTVVSRRRSALPTPSPTTTTSPSTATVHTRSRSNPEADARAAADRQARIERLRSCGWQRKRFDARRYEELCEAVMAELS